MSVFPFTIHCMPVIVALSLAWLLDSIPTTELSRKAISTCKKLLASINFTSRDLIEYLFHYIEHSSLEFFSI